MAAYSDSLCQSYDGLCSWPPPESVPTPSAFSSPGKKSHRSSVESPCRSGPPSRSKNSCGRMKRNIQEQNQEVQTLNCIIQCEARRSVCFPCTL